MSYSKEVTEKAKEKLRDRRESAFSAADFRREKLYGEVPRLSEIDAELSQIGVNTARAVLGGKNAAEELTALSEKSLLLQEERKNLLASLGYDENFTEPHFFCEKCADTGYIEKENKTLLCDCFLKLLSDTACEALNEVSPLTLSTFESFRLDYYSSVPDKNGKIPLDRMSKIFNFCRDYADNFSLSSKSLLMRGATGLGKTHLSLSIANDVMKKGFSVVYVSAPDILSKIEREHFSYDYDAKDETFSRLVACDLLILDDLGTEFATQFTASTVYNIFNSRINAGKPMIISTNMSLSELEGAYSQRFISRVMGTCDRLDFIGSDVRPKL